jgi:Fe-S cluster assembly iron-binding protein IscA
MFQVTDTARDEINKVMTSEQGKDNYLIIYFQGQSCSGPSLGMALDSSTENLEAVEHNGITAYIDPQLHAFLKDQGGIRVDYLSNQESGQAGYIIRTGRQADGTACGGCSCGSEE